MSNNGKFPRIQFPLIRQWMRVCTIVVQETFLEIRYGRLFALSKGVGEGTMKIIRGNDYFGLASFQAMAHVFTGNGCIHWRWDGPDFVKRPHREEELW